MTEKRDPEDSSVDAQQSNKSIDTQTGDSGKDSWKNRMSGIWDKATASLMQFLPLEQVTQSSAEWFRVNEAQVAEILESVRTQLPTTEAVLIGKPQAGKSSIVRELQVYQRK